MEDEKKEPAQVPATTDPGKSLNVAIVNGQFQVDSFDALWRVSNMLAKSGLVPKDFVNEPSKVFVACAYGLELGLKPMTAIQNIYVVNNRPTIFGDAPLALAQPAIDWIEETFVGEPFPKGSSGELKDWNGDFTAVCRVKPKGSDKIVESTFSVADARVAKLWMKKGYNQGDTPWITHPKRMLKLKARNFALRDAAPAALKGVGIYEDMAYVDEPSTVTVESSVVKDTRNHLEVLPAAAAPEPSAEAPPTPDDHEGILAAMIKEHGLVAENVETLIADIMKTQAVTREPVVAQIASEPASFVNYYRQFYPDKPTAPTEPGKGRKATPRKKSQPAAPAAPPAAETVEATAAETAQAPEAPPEPPAPVEEPPTEPEVPEGIQALAEDAEAGQGQVFSPAETAVFAITSKAFAEDPDFKAKGYTAQGVFECYLKWAKDHVAKVSGCSYDIAVEALANQGEPTIKVFKRWLLNPVPAAPKQEPAKSAPPAPAAPAKQAPLELKGDVPSWKEKLSAMKMKFPVEFEKVRAEMGFSSQMPTEEGAKVFVEKIHSYLDQVKKGVKKPVIK